MVMKAKETYTPPEILLAEIKENLLELEVSGIDNMSVNLFSAKRKDLYGSGSGGFFTDYL